jgi:hypothetical protein
MGLNYHAESFLFVNAGFDDALAKILHKRGGKGMSLHFRKPRFGKHLDLYYGSFANTVRTT